MSKQQAKPESKTNQVSYVIASDFRDKDNFNIEYKAGQPALFEGDRLAELLDKGLVIAK